MGEAQAASPHLAAASTRSPKVRGAQSVLGTRPSYAVHPHRRRCTRTRCARTRRGQFRAGKRRGGRASERAGRCVGAVCSRCGARWLVRGAWRAVRGACADAAGCQPSAGDGVGERWQKPRAGQCPCASFAVFCDRRRTPRLRVLSLLRLCSDMLERARESEREREERCGDLQVRGVQREREMCCKCSNFVEESERRGVVRCHCLKYIYIYTQRERERNVL